MTNSFELLQHLHILWHEEKVISIVIPDYVRPIDRYIILTYTENNKMIPERMATSSYLTAQELSSSHGGIRQGCQRAVFLYSDSFLMDS